MERPEPPLTRDDFLEQEDWLRYCAEGGVDPFEAETCDDPEPVTLGPGPWAQRFAATYGATADLRREMREGGPESWFLTWPEFWSGYQAIAFANCMGRVLNVMITIAWETVGVTLERTAEMYQARLLAAADRFCAELGLSPAWVWVFERGERRGLHSHILIALPEMLATLYCPKLARELAVLCGRDLLDTPESKTLKFDVANDWNVIKQWDGLKYVFKGVDPDRRIKHGRTGQVVPLHEVVGVGPKFQGLICGPRCGWSDAIGDEARARWQATHQLTEIAIFVDDHPLPVDLYGDRYLQWHWHEVGAGRWPRSV